jgi:peptidoglycan/xylan/chitin deacetylase (PgdA/CDA1 family)
MLSVDQLRAFARGGVEIGAHGAAHVALPLFPDQGSEISRARHDVAILSGFPDMLPETFSFPHGVYNAESLRAARAEGCAAIFTSDPVLNSLDQGTPGSDVLGRITIVQPEIVDRNGRFRPELLALWLFRRPCEALGITPSSGPRDSLVTSSVISTLFSCATVFW